MNGISLLLAAVVAIVCGTIAQLTSGYSRGGWIVNLALGFFGALAGVVAARYFNAPEIYNLQIQTTKFPIIYSIVGSVFFLAAVGFLVKPGRH